MAGRKDFARDDPNYELNPELDADFSKTGQGVSAALKEAILRINKETGLSLTLADFNQKVYAIAYHSNYTSKNETVGWKCEREAKVDSKRGVWHIGMSMDDPRVAGKKPDGPNCPHIGYEFYFKPEGVGAKPKRTGHILVMSVPASRPKPSEAKRDPHHTRRS
jgi:hypothetical protein